MEYFNAFWVGGLVCLIAQLLIDFTKLTPARILTGCVVLGVILSAVGVFEPLQEFAGAGVTVPLLGFGNTMAEGVKGAINISGPMGILTGGLAASAAGIGSAILLGFLGGLIGKSRLKK
ncbi:MAG: SpoVA/SpoVAEb family sporulation membrane protein [Ruminococcus sp.]